MNGNDEKDALYLGILPLSELSYSLECERSTELKKESTLLLILSISSLCALSLAGHGNPPLLVFSTILLLISKLRFPYKTMQNAKDLMRIIEEDSEYYKYDWQFVYQRIIQLGEIQESKHTNNDIIAHMINASLIFMISEFVIYGWSMCINH